MGVLARILRRSKAAEEATAETASAADASTGTPAEGIGAEQAGEPTTAQESAEAEQAGNAAEPETEKTTEPVAVAGTDGVEIPRQQSAEEAADSEAGDGART
ncbi:hypothetical protein OHU34_11565 [Streptomyces sp. NBC_00080]|uniref:hypothetical protein n=1 Tax=Streptomyces TaxID=1883 RepID=UPI001E3DA965|nr:hypothetical protein [Streptomyces coriariae]